jgi:hypothetical protein
VAVDVPSGVAKVGEIKGRLPTPGDLTACDPEPGAVFGRFVSSNALRDLLYL